MTSHYEPYDLLDITRTWEEVVSRSQIHTFDPYVFLYCKADENATAEPDNFLPNGEMKHLNNTGRESHTYIWHIVHNLDDLAQHTMFHQDRPEDVQLLINRLSLLSNSTGMLALGAVAACTCQDCFLQNLPKIQEVWAMMQQSFCAPTDKYFVFLRGAFVASSQRIQAVPIGVYISLLAYLEAPNGHWVHDEHSFSNMKLSDNPLSAHVLERSWNILFDCLDVDLVDPCLACDAAMANNATCPTSACQCLD